MRKGHSYQEHHNAWSEFGSLDENEQATQLLISKHGDTIRVPVISK
jgi:hypothetical protein